MTRRGALALFKATVSFSLLATLWIGFGGASVVPSLEHLPWSQTVAAVLLLAAQAPVLALRWLRIVQVLGGRTGFGFLVRVTWQGLFFNQAMPASIGGDVIRSWESYRGGLGLRTAINSVLLDRMTGLLTLVLMVACALPYLWGRLEDTGALRVLLAALFPLCVGAFFVLLLLQRAPQSFRGLPVARHLLALSADFRRLVLAPKAAFELILLGVLSNLLALGAAYAIGIGLGLQIAFLDYVALVPVAILATIVPISVAGWGVREGAMVLLFAVVGADPQTTMMLSVVFGIALVIAGLPGGLFWLLGRRVRLPGTAEMKSQVAIFQAQKDG
jgi:uncharacterized protein (TIRG00374 family)